MVKEDIIRRYVAGEDTMSIRTSTSPPLTTYMLYKILRLAGVPLRGNISTRKVVPENTLLLCSCCGKEKPAKDFSKHSGSILGYDTSRCKFCKKSRVNWKSKSIESKMLNRAKSRSKNRGLEFNLTIDDIILPTHCPVFGVEFKYGDADWTYSIDRIDSRFGYVRGNIQIISNKANRLKNNATVEDIRLLYNWMLTQKPYWQLTWKDIDEINSVLNGELSAVHADEASPVRSDS